MDCKEAIMTRRSIRKYKAEPVPAELLQEILDAGTMAPSAVNYQPWYFVAVQSRDAMGKLLEIAGRTAEKMEPGLLERFPTHPEVAQSTCAFVRKLGGAPVCILAFQEQASYAHSPAGIHQSIAAGLENMLLAAWSLGIGSCWLTAPVNHGFGEELRAAFAPDKGELVALVTLGYPDETPRMPRRKEGRAVIV